jgi:hypothetical protein
MGGFFLADLITPYHCVGFHTKCTTGGFLLSEYTPLLLKRISEMINDITAAFNVASKIALRSHSPRWIVIENGAYRIACENQMLDRYLQAETAGEVDCDGKIVGDQVELSKERMRLENKPFREKWAAPDGNQAIPRKHVAYWPSVRGRVSKTKQ